MIRKSTRKVAKRVNMKSGRTRRSRLKGGICFTDACRQRRLAAEGHNRMIKYEAERARQQGLDYSNRVRQHENVRANLIRQQREGRQGQVAANLARALVGEPNVPVMNKTSIGSNLVKLLSDGVKQDKIYEIRDNTPDVVYATYGINKDLLLEVLERLSLQRSEQGYRLDQGYGSEQDVSNV